MPVQVSPSTHTLLLCYLSHFFQRNQQLTEVVQIQQQTVCLLCSISVSMERNCHAKASGTTKIAQTERTRKLERCMVQKGSLEVLQP